MLMGSKQMADLTCSGRYQSQSHWICVARDISVNWRIKTDRSNLTTLWTNPKKKGFYGVSFFCVVGLAVKSPFFKGSYEANGEASKRSARVLAIEYFVSTTYASLLAIFVVLKGLTTPT